MRKTSEEGIRETSEEGKREKWNQRFDQILSGAIGVLVRVRVIQEGASRVSDHVTQRISSLLKRTLVHFGNPPKVSILEVLISILEVLISILIGYSFHFGNGIQLIWKWYPLDLEMVST